MRQTGIIYESYILRPIEPTFYIYTLRSLILISNCTV
jgi:hypothetical protein